MSKAATPGVIVVKQDRPHGWTMMTPRSSSAIHFNGRQRALQFARAYAKLNPPVTLRVLDESGAAEIEEVFEDALREESAARRPVKAVLVPLPSK